MRPIIMTTLCALAAAAITAPAAAAGYIKLGDIKGGTTDKHKNEIEVLSYSFGATQTGGGAAGKATFKEFTVTKKTDTSSARSGDPDRPLVAGRVPNPGIEREMKESGEKGGTEDIGVGELQEATGKRQHKPMTITKEVDMATPLLAKGSVTTLVPAGTCRLGARYPTAELGTGARVYKMSDVMVAGCSPASSGGGDRPMESMSLNYERIR